MSSELLAVPDPLAEVAKALRSMATVIDVYNADRQRRHFADLLTHQQVAEILKVHRVSVARLVKTGQLEGVLAGPGAPRVARETLDRFIAKGGIAPRRRGRVA